MINYSDCSLCHHSSMSWWSEEGRIRFLLGKGWTHWTLRFSPQKSSLEISLEQCPWSTFILGASTFLTSLLWRRRGRIAFSHEIFFPELYFSSMFYTLVFQSFAVFFWGRGLPSLKICILAWHITLNVIAIIFWCLGCSIMLQKEGLIDELCISAW